MQRLDDEPPRKSTAEIREAGEGAERRCQQFRTWREDFPLFTRFYTNLCSLKPDPIRRAQVWTKDRKNK